LLAEIDRYNYERQYENDRHARVMLDLNEKLDRLEAEWKRRREADTTDTIDQVISE
jgi:hypothetical protein